MMQKPAINLYTSRPADGGFRSLAALLSQQQPVNLCDLSDLRKPDTQRPTAQQLRTERADLQGMLTEVLGIIRQGEDNPTRYADQLVELRRDRDRYELRIHEISRLLGETERGGVEL